MMERSELSRTMRIDLIPDVPASPGGGDRRGRVVIQKRSATESAPVAAPRGTEIEESHFQRLFQRLYDAALITDMQGHIVDVNERAVEFFRWNTSDLRQMTLADVIAGADASVFHTVCENLEKERHTLIQAYGLRQDGSHFPVEMAVSKLDLGAMHLCFFVRDITIRRQAEDMLRTEHHALQNSGNGIAVVGLSGRIEYVNPALARMWGGASADALIGMDLRDLAVDPAAVETILNHLLEGAAETVTQELKARRIDGHAFDVEVHGALNLNAEGEGVGCVFSVMDIGDRVRAEDAERELERRRVMFESLGAACHHLGQPATMLMGNLDLLKERLRDADEGTRKLVDGALAAVDRLSVVLQRLNTVNEYRTTEYLPASDAGEGPGSRILEI